MAGLTDAKVRAAKPKKDRYKVADGSGLYLDVRPNGNKSWLMRVEVNGKRTWRAIGQYPLYSLDDARARALEIKRGVAGLSSETLKEVMTFKAAAEECLSKIERGMTNSSSVTALYRRMEIHVYPFIGTKDVSQVTTKEMYEISERLQEMGKPSTAQKVIATCSRVFRYGILKEYCTNDPCYALQGTIKKNEVKHRPALLNKDDIGRFMRSIRNSDLSVVGKHLLYFSAYTFCRPTEVLGARWDEIDIDKKTWTIPAERMKKRRTHAVPLASQVIDILGKLKVINGQCDYVFSSSTNSPLSAGTQLRYIRQLGYGTNEMTAHGFRGMASTILNENGFNLDWIEIQLAHVQSNQVRAAYNHAKYWEDRVRMMQWYADYLDELRDKE